MKSDYSCTPSGMGLMGGLIHQYWNSRMLKITQECVTCSAVVLECTVVHCMLSLLWVLCYQCHKLQRDTEFGTFTQGVSSGFVYLLSPGIMHVDAM